MAKFFRLSPHWWLVFALLLVSLISLFFLWKFVENRPQKGITPFYRLVDKQKELAAIELAGEKRWAFRTPIFWSDTYEVEIPPGGYLKFGIGVDPEWSKTNNQGIDFVISVFDKSRWIKIFIEYYKSNTWQDFEINLKRYAQTKIKLKFSTSAAVEPSNAKPALWADPRIMSHLRLKDEINILLITVDTLRSDHLRVYGYKRATSPNIDQLAKQGATFTNMFAQRSLTWPSLTSIMTSLYPNTHGVIRNGYQVKEGIISLDVILKDYGYTTASLLANYWNTLTRGFDERKSSSDFGITEEALEWLHNIGKKKFFLWLHYLNPHAAYEPIYPYDKIFDPDYKGKLSGLCLLLNKIMAKKETLRQRDLQHIVALYDGEVRQTDYLIGKILYKLDDCHLRQNTLIIITADHGEELYQHHHYFYHHASVYDSCLQIPCIMILPGIIKRNIKIDNQVQSIDILPTILDILKASFPADFQGESFYPLLRGKKIREKKPAYSQFENRILTIRTDRWKYIYNPENYRILALTSPQEKYVKIHQEELYDIVQDPQERKNLASSHREIAQQLRQQLLSWNKSLGHRRIEKQTVHKELLQKLKALGYN